MLQVPGLDAIQLGPFDLSASMGLIGQLDHPDFVAAVQHVSDVCARHQVTLGAFGVNSKAVEPYIQQGYTLITSGVDSLFLGQAANADLERLTKGRKRQRKLLKRR